MEASPGVDFNTMSSEVLSHYITQQLT
jgi:hypothetical protein